MCATYINYIMLHIIALHAYFKETQLGVRCIPFLLQFQNWARPQTIPRRLKHTLRTCKTIPSTWLIDCSTQLETKTNQTVTKPL